MIGRLKSFLRKLPRAPGVPQARYIAERAVTPSVTAHVHALGIDHAATEARLSAVEQKLENLSAPHSTVLNAINSQQGTARLLRREVEDLRARIEMIRAEVMLEMRYGQGSAGHDVTRPATEVEPTIVDQAKVDAAVAAGEVRLNIGAGHVAMDGYLNVDMRELPGIEIVAAVDRLPFEPGDIAEIFSSHILEHFPEPALIRSLLPYWFSLLRPGGTFRAIVPDLDAMATAYAEGEFSFERLRLVTYGGQEYEGDFHFTGFTPASLASMLTETGFVDIAVIAAGRPNGECLEFEIVAARPGA
jgi:hypothetical protein